MATISRNLVAVPTDNLDRAGATVWWRLREVTRSMLETEIKSDDDNGRIALPKVVEPETALRRAMATLSSKRTLVRPLKERGAWTIVSESVVTWGPDRLDYQQGAVVRLDKVGRPTFKGATDALEDQVRTAYNVYLDMLTADDLSAWLISNVERMLSVALRERGGVYYVPPESMRTMRRLVEIVERVGSGSIYVMPTISLTADGARAILDSLTAEIDSEADKLRGELISGSLGARALRTREMASRSLAAKVHEYESLLGAPMTRLTDILGTLEADAAAAALAAEAEDEEA